MRSTFKVLFYLKRNKEQPLAPVMGRITVNGTIAQISAKIEVPVRLWEVNGGRAKGKSVEADRINRHLDNIRGQINKHYQDICDHDSYVTAERVRNAYQGFDRKYQTLLEAFEKFTVDYRKRVGVDRVRRTYGNVTANVRNICILSWKRCIGPRICRFWKSSSPSLKNSTLIYPMTSECLPMDLSGYLKCLKYVAKMAFNND